jgi:hypothetical protein
MKMSKILRAGPGKDVEIVFALAVTNAPGI